MTELTQIPESDRICATPQRVTGSPIFFMHIAKTAGSYLNATLEEALGADQIATHVEHRMGAAADLRGLLSCGRTVISGHVMNGLWETIAAGVETRFRKVTILREPVAHLASHLLWLDHYNRPEFRRDYALLDEAHQRVADRIGAVDLTDIGHLDHYLATLGPVEKRLFDNCQSRYFIGAGHRDPRMTGVLTLADVRQLRVAAKGFDLILCQDRMAEGLAALGNLIGVPLVPLERRVNEAKSARTIDIANPLVRQVLSCRTLLDQWLWRWVKER